MSILEILRDFTLGVEHITVMCSMKIKSELHGDMQIDREIDRRHQSIDGQYPFNGEGK